MSYETILFAVDSGVARLTFNRPDKLNSFNVSMHEEVRRAFVDAMGIDLSSNGEIPTANFLARGDEQQVPDSQ